MSVEERFQHIKNAVLAKFRMLMEGARALTQDEVMEAMYKWAVDNPTFDDCSGEFYGNPESASSTSFRLILAVTHNATGKTMDIELNTAGYGRIFITANSKVA